MIQLPQEIKALGSFKAIVDLHTEVQAKLTIKVIAAETIE